MDSIGEKQGSVDELRAARVRLVAAADADRREIERALHDGPQQHLAALSVNLQLARQLIDSDPAAARARLDEVGRDVHAALDELRELAWRVYPSLLADHGLASALPAGLPDAQVQASALGRYAPEIERAVYFACLGASGSSVRVWEEGLNLRFEVDGARTDGEELLVICDRVAAAGGSLTVSGVNLSGSVPLPI
jgi:hypothetical protein